MSDEVIVNVARFVRDLLSYDENLIEFDRENIKQELITDSYIVINSDSPVTTLTTGTDYDGDDEEMTYSASLQRPITLEFYGSDAYANKDKFRLLSKSQTAKELSKDYAFTIFNVTGETDIKKVFGSTYGNRVHLEFNIQYCPAEVIETLRIDTGVFEFLVDS